MDGSAELMQLAALLRLGADTARQVATVRPDDVDAIERLARQAEDMAAQLEALVEAGAKARRGN